MRTVVSRNLLGAQHMAENWICFLRSCKEAIAHSSWKISNNKPAYNLWYWAVVSGEFSHAEEVVRTSTAGHQEKCASITLRPGFLCVCSSLMNAGLDPRFSQSKPVFISLVSQAKCVMRLKHLQDSCILIKCLVYSPQKWLLNFQTHFQFLGCVVSYQLLPQISSVFTVIALLL